MDKLSSLRLPWPTQWDNVFGNRRPLILEIGFGYGQFLFHLAGTHPDHNVVGLEIANRCLSAVEARLEREIWPNVRVIHSTAQTALHHLFEPGTLAQIHVNFPDPWFKQKHTHRRLMQRDSLDAMVSRLRRDGCLYLATDILDYARLCHALLSETPALTNQLETAWSESPLPGRVVTKYEMKAQRENRPCYYFAYRRSDVPAPDVPVIKDLDMPHLVFSSPLSSAEMAAQFQPIEERGEEMLVTVIDAYQGAHNKLLFEVFVKEPSIDQHFAVMLLQRDQSSEYTVQLGTLGHARSTRGVHRAVTLICNWLLSLHAETRVIKQKLQVED